MGTFLPSLLILVSPIRTLANNLLDDRRSVPFINFLFPFLLCQAHSRFLINLNDYIVKHQVWYLYIHEENMAVFIEKWTICQNLQCCMKPKKYLNKRHTQFSRGNAFLFFLLRNWLPSKWTMLSKHNLNYSEGNCWALEIRSDNQSWWYILMITLLRRQRQEDLESKANLGYKTRLCHQQSNTKIKLI
jgi:hypothetical protein